MNDIDQIYAALVARDYADRLFADLPGQHRDGRRNMKAECPFCHGNDCSHSLEEPVYHCWNCNVGGDWLDYLQKREGVDFREALQRLAAEVGAELRGFDQAAYAQRWRQNDLLRAAQATFRRDLFRPEGRPTLDYLLHCGYTEDEICEMEFGAYIDRSRLVRELREQGFTQQEIDASGLLTSSFGKTHTLAMLWPNAAGRPIDLACRMLLSDEERAARAIGEKYRFSYRLQKDQGLVGLTRAARRVRATSPNGALIIVEGLLDALYLNVKGIPTVALGGTSLAPSQVQAIAATRLEQVILVLDNDLASQRGMAAAIERLHPSGLQVFVARLPDRVKDPDELVRTRGPAPFVAPALTRRTGRAGRRGGWSPRSTSPPTAAGTLPSVRRCHTTPRSRTGSTAGHSARS